MSIHLLCLILTKLLWLYDASEVRTSIVLKQEVKLIAYSFEKLNQAQLNYHTYDKKSYICMLFWGILWIDNIIWCKGCVLNYDGGV